jgi:hypothetical protein
VDPPCFPRYFAVRERDDCRVDDVQPVNALSRIDDVVRQPERISDLVDADRGAAGCPCVRQTKRRIGRDRMLVRVEHEPNVARAGGRLRR